MHEFQIMQQMLRRAIQRQRARPHQIDGVSEAGMTRHRGKEPIRNGRMILKLPPEHHIGGDVPPLSKGHPSLHVNVQIHPTVKVDGQYATGIRSHDVQRIRMIHLRKIGAMR